MAGSKSTADVLDDDLRSALVQGLRGLLAEGCACGHWGDVRGTADGLIALTHCLGKSAFPRLVAASERFLERQAIAHGDGHNWDEEVWDTAVATLALAKRPQDNVEAVAKAVRWLKSRHVRAHANWNDEPWETLWALMALHEATNAEPAALSDLPLDFTLAWLEGLSKDGYLVNAHYTALLALAAGRLEAVVPRARTIKIAALDALQRRMPAWADGDAALEELWTRELWANSLAVWALGEHERLTDAQPGVRAVARWFRRELCGPADAVGDPLVLTEDRAFACVALFHALVSARSARRVGLHATLGQLPHSATLIGEAADLFAGPLADKLRAELQEELARIEDFTPRRPLCERRDAYYTLNLRKRVVDALTIATVAILTAWWAGGSSMLAGWIGETGARVARTVVLLVGGLVVALDVFGLKLRDVARRSRSG